MNSSHCNTNTDRHDVGELPDISRQSETSASLSADARKLVAPDGFDQATAIALAKASIDRLIDDEGAISETEPSADTSELANLAAVLNLLGELGRRAGSAKNGAADRPLLLGRFHILGERGRGGFGIVLRAFDPLLKRDVALKIPRPERLIAGQPTEDFVREAQVAARLEHPAIVRVYETRRMGPVWYIASEYCEGPTLDEWLDQQSSPPSWHQASLIVAEIADAVHYAHSRGVLHLDLKPENVLVELANSAGDTPRLKVTDFGLAGRCSPSSPRKEGRIAGTRAFMAPEQLAGEATLIGVATDVYALGAILHCLLDRSIHKPDSAVLTGNFLGCAPGLRSAPRDLKAVCERSLQQNPVHRYDSVGALATDLRRVLHGQSVSARKASWPERAIRSIRRRPAIAALCALLLVTASLSLGAIIHQWQRAETNLARLRSEQLVHAETSTRMRSSLLNLAWVMQENRLQPNQPAPEQDAELRLLRELYRDLRTWKNPNLANRTLDAALSAAGHSLAVAGGIPAGDDGTDADFLAGLAAWKTIVDEQPDEERWRRALALHVLSYTASAQPLDWAWWRTPGNARVSLDPETIAIVERPYALLLIEFASEPALRSNSKSYDMLYAAIELLEAQPMDADSTGELRVALLTAYNRLSSAANLLSKAKESREALDRAKQLVAAAPLPDDCPPLLAAQVAETYRLRARQLRTKTADPQMISLLSQSQQYLEQALTANQYDASIRLELAKIHRRIAQLYRRSNEIALAIERHRDAIALFDKGLLLTPGYRSMIQRRASEESAISICLLKIGNEADAQRYLEAAVRDFEYLNLRHEDSRDSWIQAIRSWQALGRIYAQRMELDRAIAAFRKSQALLEKYQPKYERNPELMEMFVSSEEALSDLMAQVSNDTP